jgi:hypothetical protein
MKYIIVLTVLFLSSCVSYKVVVQDCSQTENGDDWVCKKSIWSK